MMRTTIRNIGEPIWKWRAQRRQPFDVLLHVERVGRAQRDDVADDRGEHEPDRVDDRAPDRPEQHAVHDRERIGHRERRRRDDREHEHRQRHREPAELIEHLLDPGAMGDDDGRERERRQQDDDRLDAAQQPAQIENSPQWLRLRTRSPKPLKSGVDPARPGVRWAHLEVLARRHTGGRLDVARSTRVQGTDRLTARRR